MAVIPAPPPIVASDSATFTFGSSQEGSTFACALDSAVFQNCGSPATISVSDGEHRFFVIAIRDGDTDPTPAAWTWTADTTPPKAVVKHQVDVGYRRLVLRWGSPLSAGADSVTVLARTAAMADAAATVIANAVNVDDPRIVRRAASALKDDSDLGDIPVTVEVPPLARAQVLAALQAGAARARALQRDGAIHSALLVCQHRALAVEAAAPQQIARAAAAPVGSVFA